MGSNDKAAPSDELTIIDHAIYSADLARRRAELGNPEAPRNSGLRRTESKKALLKAIENLGGRW